MKKVILFGAIALSTILSANDNNSQTVQNEYIKNIYASVNSVNYWMGDGSDDTGVTIDTTSFSLISAGVKFTDKFMNLSLSYEGTIAEDSNDMNQFDEARFGSSNDFTYSHISIRPFSALGYKKIELGYENLSTSTVGHLTYDFNGNLLYRGTITRNTQIKGDIPLNYDIEDISLKYYFGEANNPSKWYIGYRQINSTQPYIETASSVNNVTPEIRLDEEFVSQQFILGMYKDFNDLTKGVSIKEFRFGWGPTETDTNYDELSGTQLEVDWSMNFYVEPVIKFSDSNANFYISAYYGYDVIWLSDDKDKGAGDVLSETSKYGFKLYYIF